MRRTRSFTAAAAVLTTLTVLPGAIATVPHPAVSWADPCASVGGRHVSVGGCADPGARVDDVPPPQDATSSTPPPADPNACVGVHGRRVGVNNCG